MDDQLDSYLESVPDFSNVEPTLEEFANQLTLIHKYLSPPNMYRIPLYNMKPTIRKIAESLFHLLDNESLNPLILDLRQQNSEKFSVLLDILAICIEHCPELSTDVIGPESPISAFLFSVSNEPTPQIFISFLHLLEACCSSLQIDTFTEICNYMTEQPFSNIYITLSHFTNSFEQLSRLLLNIDKSISKQDTPCLIAITKFFIQFFRCVLTFGITKHVNIIPALLNSVISLLNSTVGFDVKIHLLDLLIELLNFKIAHDFFISNLPLNLLNPRYYVGKQSDGGIIWYFKNFKVIDFQLTQIDDEKDYIRKEDLIIHYLNRVFYFYGCLFTTFNTDQLISQLYLIDSAIQIMKTIKEQHYSQDSINVVYFGITFFFNSFMLKAKETISDSKSMKSDPIRRIAAKLAFLVKQILFDGPFQTELLLHIQYLFKTLTKQFQKFTTVNKDNVGLLKKVVHGEIYLNLFQVLRLFEIAMLIKFNFESISNTLIKCFLMNDDNMNLLLYLCSFTSVPFNLSYKSINGFDLHRFQKHMLNYEELVDVSLVANRLLYTMLMINTSHDSAYMLIKSLNLTAILPRLYEKLANEMYSEHSVPVLFQMYEHLGKGFSKLHFNFLDSEDVNSVNITKETGLNHGLRNTPVRIRGVFHHIQHPTVGYNACHVLLTLINELFCEKLPLRARSKIALLILGFDMSNDNNVSMGFETICSSLTGLYYDGIFRQSHTVPLRFIFELFEIAEEDAELFLMHSLCLQLVSKVFMCRQLFNHVIPYVHRYLPNVFNNLLTTALISLPSLDVLNNTRIFLTFDDPLFRVLSISNILNVLSQYCYHNMLSEDRRISALSIGLALLESQGLPILLDMCLFNCDKPDDLLEFKTIDENQRYLAAQWYGNAPTTQYTAKLDAYHTSVTHLTTIHNYLTCVDFLTEFSKNIRSFIHVITSFILADSDQIDDSTRVSHLFEIASCVLSRLTLNVDASSIDTKIAAELCAVVSDIVCMLSEENHVEYRTNFNLLLSLSCETLDVFEDESIRSVFYSIFVTLMGCVTDKPKFSSDFILPILHDCSSSTSDNMLIVEAFSALKCVVPEAEKSLFVDIMETIEIFDFQNISNQLSSAPSNTTVFNELLMVANARIEFILELAIIGLTPDIISTQFVVSLPQLLRHIDFTIWHSHGDVMHLPLEVALVSFKTLLVLHSSTEYVALMNSFILNACDALSSLITSAFSLVNTSVANQLSFSLLELVCVLTSVLCRVVSPDSDLQTSHAKLIKQNILLFHVLFDRTSQVSLLLKKEELVDEDLLSLEIRLFSGLTSLIVRLIMNPGIQALKGEVDSLLFHPIANKQKSFTKHSIALKSIIDFANSLLQFFSTDIPAASHPGEMHLLATSTEMLLSTVFIIIEHVLRDPTLLQSYTLANPVSSGDVFSVFKHQIEHNYKHLFMCLKNASEKNQNKAYLLRIAENITSEYKMLSFKQ
ncbi:hypothetical protein PCE1_002027 [Barthelona sp. PCE]